MNIGHQVGDVLDYTNSGTVTITNNSVVVIGDRIGVALTDIAAGATGAIVVKNKVVLLPKDDSAPLVQGQACYWDDSAGEITDEPSGNTAAGYAAYEAATDAETVYVSLNA